MARPFSAPILGVRNQLLFSYIIVLLPVLIFGVLWLESSTSDQYNRFERRAESEAERTSDGVASLLNSSITMAQSFSELPDVKAQDIDQMNDIFAKQLALNPMFNNIAFVNKQGVRVAAGLEGPEGKVFVGDRQYFMEAVATGRTTVGEAIISRGGRVRDHPIVTVAAPVRDSSGAIVGILVVNSIVEELQKQFSDMGDPRGLYAFVVDQKGKMVFHPNARLADEMRDESALPPVQAALRGESGIIEFTHPADQLPYLAAYRPIPESPWGVVAVQPLSAVNRAPSRLL